MKKKSKKSAAGAAVGDSCAFCPTGVLVVLRGNLICPNCNREPGEVEPEAKPLPAQAVNPPVGPRRTHRP